MAAIKMILCVALALAAALHSTSAQVATATITNLIPAGSTATGPANGIVLRGSNGKRYLWIPDHLQGICKVLPSIDDTPVAPATYGISAANCILGVGASLAIKAGQLAFDPVGNFIFAADLTSNNGAIVRLSYNATQNAGAGGISGGTLLLAGCPSTARTRPDAVAYNPNDRSLYIAYLKGNAITRLTNASGNPTCNDNIQIGTVADRKKGLNLAFIGNDLWEVDGTGLAVVLAANTCTNARQCTATPRFATQIVLPQTVASDPSGNLYVGGPTNLYRINPTTGVVSLLATTFQNIMGINYAPAGAVGTTPFIVVIDDITAGAVPFQAAVWKVIA